MTALKTVSKLFTMNPTLRSTVSKQTFNIVKKTLSAEYHETIIYSNKTHVLVDLL